MTKDFTIFDIPITAITQKDAIEKIISSLKNQKKLFITTPNPEILIKSLKDTKYKEALQNSNLNLADGNGIIWAKRYFELSKKYKNPLILILLAIYSLITFIFHKKDPNIPLKAPIHGSDLLIEILKNQDFHHFSFFLLGNINGLNPKISKITSTIINQKYPHIQIAGHYDSTAKNPNNIEKINQSKAQILLIGFGAPNQELWIYKNFNQLKNIKVAIGLGGSFDFISNILPRAPKWMRKLSLEWLYRLIRQPKRLKRILVATVIFPIEVVKYRIKLKNIN